MTTTGAVFDQLAGHPSHPDTSPAQLQDQPTSRRNALFPGFSCTIARFRVSSGDSLFAVSRALLLLGLHSPVGGCGCRCRIHASERMQEIQKNADARVAKLADAQDLGSCGVTRAGSIPASRIRSPDEIEAPDVFIDPETQVSKGHQTSKRSASADQTIKGLVHSRARTDRTRASARRFLQALSASRSVPNAGRTRWRVELVQTSFMTMRSRDQARWSLAMPDRIGIGWWIPPQRGLFQHGSGSDRELPPGWQAHAA